MLSKQELSFSEGLSWGSCMSHRSSTRIPTSASGLDRALLGVLGHELSINENKITVTIIIDCLSVLTLRCFSSDFLSLWLLFFLLLSHPDYEESDSVEDGQMEQMPLFALPLVVTVITVRDNDFSSKRVPSISSYLLSYLNHTLVNCFFFFFFKI